MHTPCIPYPILYLRAKPQSCYIKYLDTLSTCDLHSIFFNPLMYVVHFSPTRPLKEGILWIKFLMIKSNNRHTCMYRGNVE